MSDRIPAGPLLITPTGNSLTMQRLSLLDACSGFDEAWLQATLFANPGVLPIDEIDAAYVGCVPLCRELRTDAGFLDILYATPEGRLVIVETKLWRNPEARRTVVTQTLDYAKELASWGFEDLTREVARSQGAQGKELIEIVRGIHPTLNERDFIDRMTVTLTTGRFLLLIVGDGIREGVHALTQFLDRYGSLEFSFGLVEVGVYEEPTLGRLIHPRVLAKSAILKRSVITLEKGLVLQEAGPVQEAAEEVDEEWASRSAYYLAFWTRFLQNFGVDDATQPIAKPSKTENIYFYMPPANDVAWVSAYFAQSKQRVGVYLRLVNSDIGRRVFEAVKERRAEIDAEFGGAIVWTDKNGKYGIAVRMPYDDLGNEATLRAIEVFFQTWLNRFISYFRPLLTSISAEQGYL